MEFIEPNRSKYIPSPKEPDEDGVMDIGYTKGTFCDGRSYRVECWRMDEIVMATMFFSDKYMTAWKKKDFALLLELEGIVKFNQQLVQASRTKDDAGNNVWAVNITIHNAKGTHADLLLPLQRYK